MTTFFYLPTCSTCKRVLTELGPGRIDRLRDIKSDPLTAGEVDNLAARAGGYANLFSRRARKYRSLGLAERKLTEADYRQYILEDYTFLKRPVLLTDRQIFVGSAGATVAAAKRELHD